MNAITVVAEAGGQLFEFMITPSRIEERELTASLPDRIAGMNNEFNEESYGEDEKQVIFLLLSADGQILAHSRQQPEELGYLCEAVHFQAGKTWLTRHRREKHTVMALYKRLYDGNVLVIAGNLAEAERNLAYLASILGIVMAFMLVVSLVGSWLLAAMFVEGLNRVKKAAAHIANGDFGQRVKMGREGREINELAVVFNDMVDKTEKLLLELKTVSTTLRMTCGHLDGPARQSRTCLDQWRLHQSIHPSAGGLRSSTEHYQHHVDHFPDRGGHFARHSGRTGPGGSGATDGGYFSAYGGSTGHYPEIHARSTT